MRSFRFIVSGIANIEADTEQEAWRRAQMVLKVVNLTQPIDGVGNDDGQSFAYSYDVDKREFELQASPMEIAWGVRRPKIL